MTALRIAFFGLPLAGWLLHRDGHRLVLAVLPPIEGPGRRRLRRALDRGIDAARGPACPVVDLLPGAEGPRPEPDLDALLLEAHPDLLVSWFWTRRFTGAQLRVPRLGAVGAHPSLLPRHRGPNPYFAAIDAGDSETGVTIHRLTEEYDEGAVLAVETLPVGSSNSWQLARRLDRPSLRQLRSMVARIAAGERLPETSQDESQATWAPEPSGDLLRVDFEWPTERILRRVRALAPTPGLALEFSGVRFFVLAADRAPIYPQALLPGEGAVVGSPPELVVRTGDGAFRVLLAELAGGQSPGGRGSVDAGIEAGEGGEIVTGQRLAEWVAIR